MTINPSIAASCFMPDCVVFLPPCQRLVSSLTVLCFFSRCQAEWMIVGLVQGRAQRREGGMKFEEKTAASSRPKLSQSELLMFENEVLFQEIWNNIKKVFFRRGD